ncbi:hypothetical protein L2E82_15583 [Cichorium intybus]|uniref:Uncharacterized protein n=1 Tax=Cichorium intybus TaxID=13427 RepID=A0ACB9F3L8_CICIN|nr:hypothetical protein L2E82_15583 [Cichorium intybus]
MMRELLMLVRETAAEQLEERQSDWAYSNPVVIPDLVWNLAFVIVSAGRTRSESYNDDYRKSSHAIALPVFSPTPFLF